jgi:hypothetical protein
MTLVVNHLRVFFGDLEQLSDQVGNVLLNKEVGIEVRRIDLLREVFTHHSVRRNNMKLGTHRHGMAACRSKGIESGKERRCQAGE